MRKKTGEAVRKGEVLATLYGNDEKKLETAAAGEISPREEENDLFSDMPVGISHSRAADYGSLAEAAENDGRAKTASGRSVRSGTEAEGLPELRTEQYASPEARRITKVVVFYDDNTYQELK